MMAFAAGSTRTTSPKFWVWARAPTTSSTIVSRAMQCFFIASTLGNRYVEVESLRRRGGTPGAGVNSGLVYQMSFSDNCICLESVAVWSAPESLPADGIHPLPLGSPVAGHGPACPGVATIPGFKLDCEGSKRAKLATGGLKLARF